MEIPVIILETVLTRATSSVVNWFIEKWDDEKAFDYSKERIRFRYEEKLKPAIYDGIVPKLRISKEDICSITINEESINIISSLSVLLQQRISTWIENRDENVVRSLIGDFIKSTLEYHLSRKIGIVDKVILDLLYQLLDSQHKNPIYLDPLYKLIALQPDFESLKNYLDNDLLYFTDEEYAIINEVQKKIIRTDGVRKPILISGLPATGKTYLSFYIGVNLMKEKYCTYYININNPSLDYIRLMEELNTLPIKSVVIFDDCHDRVDLFKEIITKCWKFSNINFLFISRDLSVSDYNFDTHGDFNLIEFLQDNHYNISDTNFYNKAKGIILKYKQYRESTNNQIFEIGNIQFVINNAHQNLVSLDFNLQMWRHDLPLDHVDKNKVFEKLYDKYFKSDTDLLFMLVLASLYKYEIYLDGSEKFSETAVELCKKGLIRKEKRSNYYYLYHSSFAKLLLNAYSIHSEFRKYKGQDDLVYNKIRDYILSFEKYPLNFDNIFYYLNSNHGLDVGRELLKDENIISRFLDFHRKNKINVELYLFLLYRLNKIDTRIAERLNKEISDDIWKKNLMEMSFPRFSLSLFHLDRLNPDKACSILNSIELSDLVQKIKNSNLKLHLLTNSIREIVRISGSTSLGIKLLNGLAVDYLVEKMKNTNLIHLGKTISELHATSPQIAEEVITKIEPAFISKLIKDSDLKSYSKSLNEIKKTHPQLASIFLNATPVETLINQLIDTDLRLEGISRSLTELSKIDPSKAKKLFYNLPTDKLLILIYDSSIIQIAQSLSELLSIDKKDEIHKKKISEIFLELDEIKLSKKINNKSTKFHNVGDALSLLKIFDIHKNKLTLILNKIDKLNLLSKASKSTFHEFCIGIAGTHVCDETLSSYLLKNIDKLNIIRKVNESTLEFVGSDLNKLSKINKTMSDELLKRINWGKIISRGKNIKFTSLVDSVTALSNYDKLSAKKLLQIFEIKFLIKRASYLNKNALLDSCNKLYTVDRKVTQEIVLGLKRSGII